MIIWQLTAEDHSHLGGPMGTEYTTTLWTKLFTTRSGAKNYVEHKESRPIKWHKGRGILTTDLGHIGYNITSKRVLEHS